MSLLVAAVVVVGVLCVLDLLFTFGVVRRLREHTKLLDALYELAGTGGLDGLPVNGPTVGDRVGEFAVTTVDGVPVSRDSLADPTVVAFVSPECKGCREQLPALLEWAKGQDRERVLVVVDGRGTEYDELVDRLRPLARVVVQDAGTALADAFRIASMPAFCVVGEGGELRVVSGQVSRLPVAARA